MPKTETLKVSSLVKIKIACHKCDGVLSIEYVDYYGQDEVYEFEVLPCPNCCIGDKNEKN